MELNFPNAYFRGSHAQISLSSESFLIKSQNGDVTVPVSNIIGIVDFEHEEPGGPTPSPHDDRATLKLLSVEDVSSDQAAEKSPDIHFRNLVFSYSPADATPISISPLYIPHIPSHLRLPPSNNVPNLHIIISTYSGTQQAAEFFSHALQPLLTVLGISGYKVHTTESADSVSTLTRTTVLPAANNGIQQLIILLSGDGGISDMVHTLLGERLNEHATVPRVALIPMGTGNALFNSSCRPRPRPGPRRDGKTPESTEGRADEYHSIPDATYGLRTLLHGVPQRIPTLTVKFSPGSQFVSYPPIPESPGNSSPQSPSQDPNSDPDPKPILSPLPPENALHACILASWCLHASLVSLSDAPRYRTQGISRFQSAAHQLLFPANGKGMHQYRGRVEILRSTNGSWTSLRPGLPEAEANDDDEHNLTGADDAGPNSTNPSQSYTYLLATLVSHLEPDFLISPFSSPSGPSRLYLLSTSAPAPEILRLLQLAYKGGKHVDYNPGGSISVSMQGVMGLRMGDGGSVDRSQSGSGGGDGDGDEEREGEAGEGPGMAYRSVSGIWIHIPDEDDGNDDDGNGGADDGKDGLYRRICVDGKIVQIPPGGWVEVRLNEGKVNGPVDVIVVPG